LTNEAGFKLRRSDIINIIIGIFYVSTLVWGIASIKASVDINTAWRIQNENLPISIERIERWMDDNKELPDDVLTLKLDLKYLSKDIQKLTNELKKANNNFIAYNKYRKDK